jgi:hypothetical protein
LKYKEKRIKKKKKKGVYMKTGILFLVGFGVLLMIGSNFFGGVVVLLLGLAMIGGGVFLGFRPGGILRKERAIDNWSALIDEACIENGDSQTPDKFYKDVSTFIHASEAPNLRVERKHLSPSILRGLAGDAREFLVLTDTTNNRIKPYQIFMSARPYGINLAAEWYLTYKPTPLMAILSLIPFVSLIPQTLADIDLFDQQDLRAYAANAHHCMLRTVEELMAKLHQDPSKLEKKSSGFLGVA